MSEPQHARWPHPRQFLDGGGAVMGLCLGDLGPRGPASGLWLDDRSPDTTGALRFFGSIGAPVNALGGSRANRSFVGTRGSIIRGNSNWCMGPSFGATVSTGATLPAFWGTFAFSLLGTPAAADSAANPQNMSLLWGNATQIGVHSLGVSVGTNAGLNVVRVWYRDTGAAIKTPVATIAVTIGQYYIVEFWLDATAQILFMRIGSTTVEKSGCNLGVISAALITQNMGCGINNGNTATTDVLFAGGLFASQRPDAGIRGAADNWLRQRVMNGWAVT